MAYCDLADQLFVLPEVLTAMYTAQLGILHQNRSFDFMLPFSDGEVRGRVGRHGYSNQRYWQNIWVVSLKRGFRVQKGRLQSGLDPGLVPCGVLRKAHSQA